MPLEKILNPYLPDVHRPEIILLPRKILRNKAMLTVFEFGQKMNKAQPSGQLLFQGQGIEFYTQNRFITILQIPFEEFLYRVIHVVERLGLISA